MNDWYSQFKNLPEMEKFFQLRTEKHIKTVQQYAKLIEEYDPDRFEGLVAQAKEHDASKKEDPEKKPYVLVTWKYKCKADGKDFEFTAEQKKQMDQATEHHILNNAHHPEYHSKETTDLINKNDRDKPPSKTIDATKMKDVDIGEMIADWISMGIEKNSSTEEWANNNVNIRWKFSDRQTKIIYELVDKFGVNKNK